MPVGVRDFKTILLYAPVSAFGADNSDNQFNLLGERVDQRLNEVTDHEHPDCVTESEANRVHHVQ